MVKAMCLTIYLDDDVDADKWSEDIHEAIEDICDHDDEGECLLLAATSQWLNLTDEQVVDHIVREIDDPIIDPYTGKEKETVEKDLHQKFDDDTIDMGQQSRISIDYNGNKYEVFVNRGNKLDIKEIQEPSQ